MTTSAPITCTGCKHSYQDSALYCPNCGRAKVRKPAEDALLGRVLGERFLVQEQLGQGASGTIYRAEHVTLRRRVAIKVLHTELSRDDLAVERFRREATTVAEIDNEHIVEIHDFGRTHDGRLYMAMELLEGETLDGVIARETTLSVERTADILVQVGEALMEAHAIGYVHRDLRPRNVYLATRRGKANFVKLLDFGLAKLVETDAQAASTSLGMTFGDPRYMSPEQARGDRIDPRADIYQLGCIAYEMLTGAPPFSGNRVFDILTKQVSEAPVPLPTRRPGVPLWMEQGVAKMLAKDPNNRFATMSRMVDALRRGLDNGEVMDDEVARRRESVPPPSVSRVMQRLGMQGEASSSALPAAGKPFDPRQTQVGTPPAPAAAAPVAAAPKKVEPKKTEPIAAIAAPAAETHHELPPAASPATTAPLLPAMPAPSPASTAPLPAMAPRRRTGTPRVGVPVVPQPDVEPDDDDSQAPVAGTIDDAAMSRTRRGVGDSSARVSRSGPSTSSSSGRTRRPAEDDDADGSVATLRKPRPPQDPLATSQVWFDAGDDANESRARARKPFSPSLTDLDEYEPPRKNRIGLYAAIGAFVFAGGGIVLALVGGGSAERKAAPPQPAQVVAAVPADAAPSTVIEQPDPPAITATPIPPPPAPVVAVAPAPLAPAPATPTPTGHHAPSSHAPSGHAPPPSFSTYTPPPDHGGRVPTVDDDPAERRPTGLGPVSPPVTPPTRKPGVSGADGPVDPYAPADPPPDAGGDKKSEFYANLGTQQLASGDTAAAAASYKRATELDPRNVIAVTGLGEIALRQGLFGDAIAHLNRAAKLAPRSSRVFTLLGEAYMNAGQSAQAVANFKKALQLDPDNARAREGFNDASARVPPPTDD